MRIDDDAAAAKTDLLASLQGDPDNPVADDQLAQLAVRQQDWRAAASYSSQAISLNPEDEPALLTRSGAELGMKKYAAAKTDALAAIRINADPAFAALAWSNLAYAVYGEGHYRAAVPDLEKAVRLNPGDQDLADTLAAARRLLAD